MKRRYIIIAAALTLGVAPVAAISTPAYATNFKICTAFGSMWCLGASSITDGTAIKNSNPGRDFIIQDQKFKNAAGHEVYRFVFTEDTSKCAGFSAAGRLEVRDCSGNSNFTNWQNEPNPNNATTQWQNNSYNSNNCSSIDDQGIDLTSDNALGHQLYCSKDFFTGEYLAFTPKPTP